MRLPGYRGFNPRSREGSDGVTISINYTTGGFNPRSREGSDFGSAILIAGAGMFQSTLPRRERQKTEKLSGQTQCFNPRSREGSDKKLQPCPLMFHVFQSTLPRRERRNLNNSFLVIRQFQSTLPRRERLLCHFIPFAESRVSIHAPAKGATAISAKNSFQFSAEINKLSFYILSFPLFPLSFFYNPLYLCTF